MYFTQLKSLYVQFKSISSYDVGMTLPCSNWRKMPLLMTKFGQLVCHRMGPSLPTTSPAMLLAGVVSTVRLATIYFTFVE